MIVRNETMSFTKLQTLLTLVFIITSGVISVTAQTPSADNSSTKPPPDASTKNAVEVAGTPTTNAKPIGLSEMETPRSPQAVDADDWQFQVTPYFWLAGLHGTGGTSARTADVDLSFGDVFDALNFFFMTTFEARKGKFISLTDVEYVSVSDDRATPGPLFSTVDAGFKTFIFDQEVGYRLLENSEKGASLDVLGGRSSLAGEDGFRVWCWNPSGNSNRGQPKLGGCSGRTARENGFVPEAVSHRQI